MVPSPFLAPLLRLTSRTSRKSCARVFSDTPSPLQAFEINLAAGLQQLVGDGSHSSPDQLSLAWMCQALDVVISAQSSTMQAISMCTSSAASLDSDKLTMSRMVEQYMEENLKMLDMWSLVKDSMAGVGAYVKACHIALKRLQGSKLAQQGDIQRAKHAVLSARHVQGRVLLHLKANPSINRQQFSKCSSILRRTGSKMTPPALSPDPLSLQEHSAASIASAALYGGEMCAVFFLRLLSTALSSSPTSHKAMAPLQMSGQSAAWAPTLLTLQAQLNSALQAKTHKKSEERLTLFSELQSLEAAMSQIEGLLNRPSTTQADLKCLVTSTSLLSRQLETSMARLDHQVECLRSALIDIRMTLLP